MPAAHTNHRQLYRGTSPSGSRRARKFGFWEQETALERREKSAEQLLLCWRRCTAAREEGEGAEQQQGRKGGMRAAPPQAAGALQHGACRRCLVFSLKWLA